ncbi:MAG: hypothetical protein ACRDNK_09170 [Solirubrobacteraceae bacterium]
MSEERARVEIQSALDELVSSRSRPGSTCGMVGINGSAAYADIDSGVAVAVMRNRFAAQLTTVTRIDRIVADTLS